MSRPNPYFDADLAYGLGREESILSIIRLGKVEVKSDRRAADTGNVFVEVYQGHGGASGLAKTTAPHWLIEVTTGTWVLVETNRLKALARHAYRNRGGYVICQCGCRNKGILVPVIWLVQPWRAVR